MLKIQNHNYSIMNYYTKNSITLIAMLFLAFQTTAQGLTQPRAVSPAAELKQTIGLTEVSVNYSRPRVTLRGNDRSGKIWGQQVAWGFDATSFVDGRNIPWRAGANENTIITFSDDVVIGGKNLAAGSYGMHMAIFENGNATVIFSKNTSSWGSFYYDQKEDALRVDVKTEACAHTEMLTYDFVDMGANFGVLALSWEKLRVPVKIEVDVHSIVLASFRNELRGIPGFGWQGPMQAAQYCARNNINQEEALTWVERSISGNKNFNNLAVKSTLLRQVGKDIEAQAAIDESVAIANINQLNQLGYQMIGQQKYDLAIKYFKLNVQRNPKDPNVYDSLGEGYKLAGDNKNAIKSFKKSLSLNPPANVKANSIKLLKELGVDTSSYEAS